MKKENIVKTGVILVSVAMGGTGLGIAIHEGILDHLENPEQCLYCKINPAHMANAINRDHSDEYVARYVEGHPEYTKKVTIAANEIVLDDGRVVYTAPAGYTLDGNVATKTVISPATDDRTEVIDRETGEIIKTIKR